MRYEEDGDVETFKESIGLGEKKKKNKGDFLRWFFTVDFKDWTNYVAIALAGFLFWWGFSNILKALQMG